MTYKYEALDSDKLNLYHNVDDLIIIKNEL